jgi:Tol biopolymer transport system component
VGQWFRRIARGRNLATGTEESIGLTLDRLSAEWADSLRRRYLPEVIEHERAGEDARRLTDHTKARSSLYIAPAISPDGGEMVFITNSSFYTDIHIASALDGSHERRLLRGQRKESFETFRYIRTSLGWSPDGDRIALVTRNSGREVLVVYNVRKRTVEREMALGLDEMFSPTWSPDGEWIAFEGLREARSNLYKVAVKGDSLVQLTHDRWATFQPAWSPDGRRIAFVTDRGYRSATGFEFFSPWRIAILNLESSDIALLPGQVGKTINPQWFPDNRHLLFISDRTRISNMFIRDLQTGRDYQITDVMTGISGITERGVAASLSARGNRVVFSVFEKMGWNLYAIRDPLARIDTVEPWEPEPGAEPPVVEADTERSIPLVAAMVGEEGGAGFTAHQIMVAGAPPTWMKGPGCASRRRILPR